jgi:protein required for attachment to host cells
MKPTRTWILIADGARARILLNTGPGHGLVAMDEMVFEGEHTATRDIVTDREGRTHNSVGNSRSAIDARSDPHRALKAKFALHLAQVLDDAAEQAALDRLILVATPVTLGDLRGSISKRVAALVVGEVPHDLTKTPNGDIASHLKDVLVV